MIFPATLFGDPSNKYVRMTLLQPMEDIKEGLARMAKFVAKHRA
jgi:aspartate/methionine/tyrosine aminotransferase